MLSLQGLEKRYGDIQALDGAEFSVEPGRMLGFLGPNGAGKTTAMRAIFGLIRLDAGSVTWRGRPVTFEDHLGFGYMPEQRGLYPKMRVAEQLVYFGRLHGMDAERARRAAGTLLDELQLSDRATDTVDALSHGNQQRVQLATALIHDPDLLVLDEPFNGLDPIGAETMAEVLRERAARGVAVVFSSHQLDLVEGLCQDVAIINRGRIVLAGDVRTIKDKAPTRVLEIEVEADETDLLGRMTDVISSSFDGHRHRLVVPTGQDYTTLLTDPDVAGRVRHFSYSTPSLSDLFKEAVA